MMMLNITKKIKKLSKIFNLLYVRIQMNENEISPHNFYINNNVNIDNL